MISLTHGRPAMVSPDVASSVPYPRFASQIHTSENSDGLIDAAFFVKSVELYEITHELTVKLYPTDTPRTKTPPGSSLEDLTTVVQLDDKITEWESTIPDYLLALPSEPPASISPSREAVILRLRYIILVALLLCRVLTRADFFIPAYCYCDLYLHCYVSPISLLPPKVAFARESTSNARRSALRLRKKP